MKAEKITYTNTVIVTEKDIDDIVCTALEGGINYWCKQARVVGDYLGEYASDQISRGGKLTLVLYEAADDTDKVEYTLRKGNLLNGIKLYMENPHPYDITCVEHSVTKLDTCHVDGVVADMIVQYAIFGEIVFG